jgi:uncharacterized protein YraI
MHNAKPLLLLALLTVAPIVSAGELWTVNAPRDGFLSLRSEPSITSGTRLAKIPHGASLKKSKCQKLLNLEGDTGHWCRAEYSGKTGWVFDAYLTASPIQAPIAAAPKPAPTTQSSGGGAPAVAVSYSGQGAFSGSGVEASDGMRAFKSCFDDLLDTAQEIDFQRVVSRGNRIVIKAQVTYTSCALLGCAKFKRNYRLELLDDIDRFKCVSKEEVR